jgi:hypothetical protein
VSVLAEIALSDVGREYVRSRLEAEKTLGRLVLSATALASGQFGCWTTTSAAPPTWNELQEGNSLSRGEADRMALRELRRLFARFPAGTFWMEDPHAKPSDPFWASRRGKPRWFFGDEMYEVGFAADGDERLLDVLRRGNDWPGWGGGGYFSRAFLAAADGDTALDESTLRDVAAHVEFVVCGAFDGESYVWWRAST